MKPKKKLSLVLVLSFILTLALPLGTPVFAASNEATYTFDISEGDITILAGTAANTLKVTYGATPTTTSDFANSQAITIIGTSTEHKVLVNLTNSTNVANITLDNADIQFATGDSCAFLIAYGTVNLTLVGTSTLKSSGSYAGLQVQGDNAVTIGGSGTLNATGGLYGVTDGTDSGGAGIGSGLTGSGGYITINSGTVNAYGGYRATGIGAWNETIVINNGDITAQGGSNGSGIGGGWYSFSKKIEIKGGTVIATGGIFAAGIGGGYGGSGEIITISGGDVTASGGSDAAGIGGGCYGSGGTVTISGGSVKASGGNYDGAGIGPGYGGAAATIAISSTAAVAASANGISLAIEAVDSSLTVGSTAYVLQANFAYASNTAVEVFLKPDLTSSVRNFAPTKGYKSIAFTVSSTGTYELHRDSLQQQNGSSPSTDFVISAVGLTTFSSVTDSDAACVAADKAALTADVIKGGNADLAHVFTNLTNPLPSGGSHGTSITWESDTTSVMASDGQTFSRPAAGNPDVTLKLTATITKGTASSTKEFSITVLAMPTTVFDISNGNITVEASSLADMLKVTHGTQVTDGIPAAQEIVITGTSNDHKVTVNLENKTVNITLDDVDLELSTGDDCPFSIDKGTVNLTLSGANKLFATGGNPGIRVANDSNFGIGTLTIKGGGSLVAKGATNGAGIGGGNGRSGGNITIESGTVTAIGGGGGAGIGGGCSGSGGTIVIKGGTVTAIGGSGYVVNDATVGGAGIGGGYNGSGADVTILAAASVTAVSDATYPAIYTGFDSLNQNSTAYVLMAYYSGIKLADTTTAVYLKADSTLKASYAPASPYGSIAFTVPSADIYEIKTADKLQKYGSGWTTDFTVTSDYYGLNSFVSVLDFSLIDCTVTVDLDDVNWTSGAPVMKLSTSSSTLSEDAIAGTLSGAVYTFEDIDPRVSYYVWDSTTEEYTGQSVSGDSPNATVDYYTVTLTSGTGISSTIGSGAYLAGSNVDISATASTDYVWSKWTLSSDSSTVSNVKSYLIENISGPIAYTANGKLPYTGDGTYWIDSGNYDAPLYATLTSPEFDESTVEISSPSELAALARAQDVNGIDFSGVTFELTQNIDLAGHLWDPIGIGADETLHGASDGLDHPFRGNLDGNGFTISNMTIEGSYISAGLFGCINLTIIDDLFSIEPEKVAISDLTVEGTVDVSNAVTVGGLVGIGEYMDIENCTNKVAVTAYGNGVYGGGIGGFVFAAVMNNSFNEQAAEILICSGPDSDETSSTVSCAGGLAGVAFYVAIYNSANFAPISDATERAQSEAGGIAAMGISAEIYNCYNTGAVTADTNETNETNIPVAGGICGTNGAMDNSEIALVKNCYNSGLVNADVAGGVAGSVYSLDNCYFLEDSASCAYYQNVYDVSTYVEGNALSSSEMKAKALRTALNEWVSDNPTSSGAVETALGIPGIYFQTWTHSENINNGYPIFGEISEDDESVVITPSDNTILIIDGKDYPIGHESVNESKIIASVEQGGLVDGLNKASQGSSAIFSISVSGSVEAQLCLQNIIDMAKKGMILTVKTGKISYELITNAINTKEIMDSLGTTDANNIVFSVRISNSTAKVEGASLVVSPVDFVISCSYNGKIVYVTNFSSFVSRSIEVSAAQAAQITTAVVVEQDGSLRQVPTKLVSKTDSSGVTRYYAVFQSLTNSSYALIHNVAEFSDISASWAKEAINEMGSRMIITGVDGENFEPDRDITRAEFAAVIVRALGLKPIYGKIIFSDVSTSDWYCGYISAASQYGLTNGYNDGTFKPNDNITREEVMTIVERAMKLTKLAPSLTEKKIADLLAPYTDSKELSSWSSRSAAACLEIGIIEGRTTNTLCPKDNITRAEVAVIAQRLLKKSGLI